MICSNVLLNNLSRNHAHLDHNRCVSVGLNVESSDFDQADCCFPGPCQWYLDWQTLDGINRCGPTRLLRSRPSTHFQVD